MAGSARKAEERGVKGGTSLALSFGARVARACRDIARSASREGLLATLTELRGRLFRSSASLLFSMHALPAMESVSVAGLTIRRVTAQDAEACLPDLEACGAGGDLHHFARGAVCYLASVDRVPVGAGWRFKESYLLDRAKVGPDAVYLGGFQVIEGYRGRGIYPAILAAICRDVLDAGCVPFIETHAENKASLRGIVKAGFVPYGRLSVIVVAGVIIRCKVDRWTS